MNEELEQKIFSLISFSGEAKSFFLAAINLAKLKQLKEAQEKIEQAKEYMQMAMEVHTQLIQDEASGEGLPLSLLLIHAQDQMMTSSLMDALSSIFVDLYANINTPK